MSLVVELTRVDVVVQVSDASATSAVPLFFPFEQKGSLSFFAECIMRWSVSSGGLVQVAVGQRG